MENCKVLTFNGKDSMMECFLDKKGTLVINGKGRMPDFSCGKNDSAPWEELKDAIKEIRIGEGITEIGIKAFEGCKLLERLILPEGFKRIHYCGFKNCSRLKEVVTAGDVEFRYIYEPNVLKMENTIVFSRETFLNVPWAVENFGNVYVSGNTLYCNILDLETVIVPEGVKRIGKYAFKNMSLKELSFPDSLKYIGHYAFAYSKVKNLVFSDSLKYIGDYAFAYSSLEYVDHNGNLGCDIREHAFDKTEFIENLFYITLKSDKKHYDCFKKITVKKRVLKTDKAGVYIRYGKESFSRKPINVGKTIFGRLHSGSHILRIAYDTKKKEVLNVETYLFNKETEQIEVRNIEPYYDEFRNGCIYDVDEVDILSNSYNYLTKEDFLNSFSVIEAEKMYKDKILRDLPENIKEEWFWFRYPKDYSYLERMWGIKLDFADPWMYIWPPCIYLFRHWLEWHCIEYFRNIKRINKNYMAENIRVVPDRIKEEILYRIKIFRKQRIYFDEDGVEKMLDNGLIYINMCEPVFAGTTGMATILTNESKYKRIVDRFSEMFTELTPYLCIAGGTRFGDMLTILYVSSDESQWAEERELLVDKTPMAYAYNLKDGFGEFGHIWYEKTYAGIKRIA